RPAASTSAFPLPCQPVSRPLRRQAPARRLRPSTPVLLLASLPTRRLLRRASAPSPRSAFSKFGTRLFSGISIMSSPPKLNKYRSSLAEMVSQPGSKAMLRAIELTDEDMHKAQVGIASTGWDGNPCNMHLNGFAAEIKKSVNASGMVGLTFHTIGVSDGISMGTEGMNFSLQSRDLIADSIETVMCAQWYDANISVVGCDKNMPGALMAMARVNRPSIMVYGGTISPGQHPKDGRPLDLVSAFEAYGAFFSEKITEPEMNEVIAHACPGQGVCGGMYTANTMAAAIETLGMSLPLDSSSPATSKDKASEFARLGPAIRKARELDLKPRDIMRRTAFE